LLRCNDAAENADRSVETLRFSGISKAAPLGHRNAWREMAMQGRTEPGVAQEIVISGRLNG